MTRTTAIRTAAGATFAVALALWTWKLLDPHPVPDDVRAALGVWDWLPFLAAKSLHVAGYSFLAVTGQLMVRRDYRPIVAGLLVVHGIVTEIGQTYVPGRDGNVRDVLIDATGIAAGTLFLRRVTRDRAAADPR